MDADRSSVDPARVGPSDMSRDEDGAQGRDSDAGRSEEGGSSPSLISRLFGRRGAADEDEEDAAPASPSAGERAMLVNVRRLRELRVIDVMVPRADIEAVDLATGLDDLVAAFRHTRHTRLPVYRDTLDDPLGFIHLKDLALRFGFNGNGHEPLDLRPLVRPMLYVPPSMPIEGLLQKMQGGRMHMALVIDEYGGVDGLVTIEDVLEQIVGDIEDEHDVADAFAWRKETDGVYICAARLEIPEFEEEAGVDLLSDELDEDVDTLGGLVFMLADRVPERGEVILHPDGHEFEVLDADPRRIKRLRVRLKRGDASGSDEAGEASGSGAGSDAASEARAAE